MPPVLAYGLLYYIATDTLLNVASDDETKACPWDDYDAPVSLANC